MQVLPVDYDYFEASIDTSTKGWKDDNDASFPYKSEASERITITYTGANADSVEVYVHYVNI